MTSEEFQAQLFKTLGNNDTLAIVVKCAIFIEAEITELLSGGLHNPKALDKLDLTYFQRCGLVVAIGLDPRFLPPLNALGKIRNKFAHRLDAKLAKSEADAFYESFDSIDKKIIITAAKDVETTRGKRFSQLDPMDRFILCAVALRAAIVYAISVQQGGNSTSTMGRKR